MRNPPTTVNIPSVQRVNWEGEYSYMWWTSLWEEYRVWYPINPCIIWEENQNYKKRHFECKTVLSGSSWATLKNHHKWWKMNWRLNKIWNWSWMSLLLYESSGKSKRIIYLGIFEFYWDRVGLISKSPVPTLENHQKLYKNNYGMKFISLDSLLSLFVIETNETIFKIFTES